MIGIACIVGAPDLRQKTLAASSGDLERAFGRLATFGSDGVELMTRDPRQLDGEGIRRALRNCDPRLVTLCTGHVFGEDNLGLVGLGAEVSQRAMQRLKGLVDLASGYGDEETLVNLGRARGPDVLPNENGEGGHESGGAPAGDGDPLVGLGSRLDHGGSQCEATSPALIHNGLMRSGEHLADHGKGGVCESALRIRLIAAGLISGLHADARPALRECVETVAIAHVNGSAVWAWTFWNGGAKRQSGE